MSSSGLIRLGGMAAVGAGVLLVISEILRFTIDFDNFRAEVTTGSWLVQSFGFMLGFVLLLGALVGLYVRQAEAAGAFGVAGFLVAFAGTALLVGGAWEEAFGTPALAEVAPQALDPAESPEWPYSGSYSRAVSSPSDGSCSGWRRCEPGSTLV